MLSRSLNIKKTKAYLLNGPWSAPAITLFIFVFGMTLIYSIEILGMAQRDANVLFRTNLNSEIVIKSLSIQNQKNIPIEPLQNSKKFNFETSRTLINKLRKIAKMDKDSQMVYLLLDGAKQQYLYDEYERNRNLIPNQ